MTDPAYVDYGFLTNVPGPVRCRGTTLYGFWARADRGRLERLCHQVFAAPSGGAVRCWPLLDHVLITFGIVARVEPQGAGFERMGHLTERQAAVWIPVLCAGPPATPLVGAFIPFMWLDNPLSLASGREIWGYAKGWGWPCFTGDGAGDEPPGAGEPDSFELDVFGIEHFDDTEEPRRLSLLEIRRSREAQASPQRELTSLAALLEESAVALGHNAQGVRELETRGLLAGVEQLFLKQVRGVGDGTRAALQQVTVAAAEIDPLTSFRARLLPPHELRVHRLDSHPLTERLGLESGRLGVCFRVRMDFTVGAGRVLWDSS